MYALGGFSFGPHHQRVVILMCDGLGTDYFEASDMPTIKRWARSGIDARVKAIMPTVTNANNASICCGTWPARHGVVGNSFRAGPDGGEAYLEAADLVRTPTLFERATAHGARSALLTCKNKTATLLGRGAEIVLAAEAPPTEWVERLGPAPDIYSCDINYWLMHAGIDILLNRPEIDVIYVHTTDYPMHVWGPEAPESKRHLSILDALVSEMAQVAPDAAFLISADHGMNFKSRAWDLEKALAARDVPIDIAISAERDNYLIHHRGLGGTAWVHLNSPADSRRIAAVIAELEGIERVLTREEAAREFKLMPERIGDLVVLGDKDTVFGHLDTEMEYLPPGFRTHGSLHELDVPLIVHNARGVPRSDYFRFNLDLARWLFPAEIRTELMPMGAAA